MSAVHALMRDRSVQVLTSFAALLGLALPIVGYSVRWLSLGISGGTPEVALAADLQRATFAGIGPVVVACAFITAIVKWDVLGFRRVAQDRARPVAQGWRLAVMWLGCIVALSAVIGIAILLIALLVLLTPIALWILWPSVIYVGFKLRRIVRGAEPMTILRLIGPALAMLVAATISGGLGPAAVLYVGDFTFESGLPAGRYAAVGEAAGVTFLRSCESPASVVVGIPTDRIQSVELAPGRVRGDAPSLVAVSRGAELVQSGCGS